MLEWVFDPEEGPITTPRVAVRFLPWAKEIEAVRGELPKEIMRHLVEFLPGLYMRHLDHRRENERGDWEGANISFWITRISEGNQVEFAAITNGADGGFYDAVADVVLHVPEPRLCPDDAVLVWNAR